MNSKQTNHTPYLWIYLFLTISVIGGFTIFKTSQYYHTPTANLTEVDLMLQRRANRREERLKQQEFTQEHTEVQISERSTSSSSQKNSSSISSKNNTESTLPKTENAHPAAEVIPPKQVVESSTSSTSSVSSSKEPSSPSESSKEQSSIQMQSSSTSSESSVEHLDDFPYLKRAMYPVFKVPNWGIFKSSAEWDRTYDQMNSDEFITIPPYNLSHLTTKMSDVEDRKTAEDISILTEKLTYSTRYFGSYDLDANEWTGVHPGIDIKLPIGTPISSIGEGIVRTVSLSDTFGLYIIIEHRLQGETGSYYSIYGHLGSTEVAEGMTVSPGQQIGSVGLTGKTTGPHLHLQIDRGEQGEKNHVPYSPTSTPSKAEADLHVVHPIDFIIQH